MLKIKPISQNTATLGPSEWPWYHIARQFASMPEREPGVRLVVSSLNRLDSSPIRKHEEGATVQIIALDFPQQSSLPITGTDLEKRVCLEVMCFFAQHEGWASLTPVSQCQTSLPVPKLPELIRAPQWLKDRRKALRRRPPPSLEDVRTYFRASAALQQRSTGKHDF